MVSMKYMQGTKYVKALHAIKTAVKLKFKLNK